MKLRTCAVRNTPAAQNWSIMQIGSMNTQEAMQKVDPSIELMASSVGEPKWVTGLLQSVPTQRLAISIYTGRWSEGVDTISDQNNFYQAVVAEPLQFKSKLEANMAAAGSRLPAHPCLCHHRIQLLVDSGAQGPGLPCCQCALFWRSFQRTAPPVQPYFSG